MSEKDQEDRTLKPYLPRLADELLNLSLQASGAVLIEGAKWCGKTRTAENMAASVLYMQDRDHSTSYLEAAAIQPSILLQGKTPRLLDEWQLAPTLWDAVRFAIDQRQEKNQFILTGSSLPADDKIFHSGTGRISRLRMRPMSLFESQESSGAVSLGAMFRGEHNISAISDVNLEQLAYLISRGGWPSSVGESEKIALKSAYNYIDSVIHADAIMVDGVSRDPDNLRALLRSYARHTASMASLKRIREDMMSDDNNISDKTLSSYLSVLKRIFVIEELPAWNPRMRSKIAMRTSPTRHFVDPSLAMAALRSGPSDLFHDFNSFALLFESLCIRDLRIYAQALDGEIYHYRDKNGLEADAVIHLHDGRWAAIEVKMGTHAFDQAAGNLLELAERVDQEKMNPPSFLMILTASSFAYQRPDSVLVVPLACLRH